MGRSSADTRDASRCHAASVPQHGRLECRSWGSAYDQLKTKLSNIMKSRKRKEAPAPAPFPLSGGGADDRPRRVPQVSTAHRRDGGRTQSGGVHGVIALEAGPEPEPDRGPADPDDPAGTTFKCGVEGFLSFSFKCTFDGLYSTPPCATFHHFFNYFSPIVQTPKSCAFPPFLCFSCHLFQFLSRCTHGTPHHSSFVLLLVSP